MCLHIMHNEAIKSNKISRKIQLSRTYEAEQLLIIIKKKGKGTGQLSDPTNLAFFLTAQVSDTDQPFGGDGTQLV